MKANLLPFCVVVLGLSVCTSAVTAAGVRTELHGTWILVTAEEGGSPIKDILGSKLVVNGDKSKLDGLPGKEMEYLGFRLDTKKKPNEIDFFNKEQSFAGIYLIQGDTLKICYNKKSKTEGRPAEFVTKKGSGLYLAVFKREKVIAAGGPKKGPEPLPEWRRSAARFFEQIDQYRKTSSRAVVLKKGKGKGGPKDLPEKGGPKDFPAASLDFLLEGGEVPDTWEVMRLYAGQVEWKGVFEGFDRKPKLAGREDKVKVKGPKGIMLHVYPGADAIKQWKELRNNSQVRYRATIEGIAGFAVPTKDGNPLVLYIVSLKDAVPLSGPVKEPVVDPKKKPAAGEEEAAAARLKTARELAANGNVSLARLRCQTIIDTYPRTRAAEEARQLLAELKKK